MASSISFSEMLLHKQIIIDITLVDIDNDCQYEINYY